MPAQLAAFPKCFLELIIDERTMTLFDWIEMAAGLPHISGLETYFPMLETHDTKYFERVREAHENHNLQMPMMCVSPDFIKRDANQRAIEIAKHKIAIDATSALGGRFCRVLSGQRQPDVGRNQGVSWVVEAIHALLPHAASRDVTLIMENHYKDGWWSYPEFAQSSEVFLGIISQIDSPHFGINYDPSNALIAGEDYIELLEAVKHRVVTMHASDRSLEGGTLEDLRQLDRDPMTGYASFVKHGVIGRGLIDYDRIFSILKSVDFKGWISIEDGQDASVGMEHLRLSAEFLWDKMKSHGLA